jgi:hypothetical protein
MIDSFQNDLEFIQEKYLSWFIEFLSKVIFTFWLYLFMEIIYTINFFGKYAINLEVWIFFITLGIINYQSGHNHNQSNSTHNYNLFSLISKLSSNELWNRQYKKKSFLKIIVEYINKKETKKHVTIDSVITTNNKKYIILSRSLSSTDRKCRNR